MAGGVLGERVEDVPEDGFQCWYGQGDQGSGDFGVFDAEHGIIGPTAVEVPLADDDQVDANGRDDNDAFQSLA